MLTAQECIKKADSILSASANFIQTQQIITEGEVEQLKAQAAVVRALQEQARILRADPAVGF